jgi:hypothetical protein
MQKVIWAINRLKNPKGIARILNNSKRATPNTKSGIIISSISIAKSDRCCFFLGFKKMLTHAKKPVIVAIKDALKPRNME